MAMRILRVLSVLLVWLLAIAMSPSLTANESHLPPHPSQAIWLLIDTEKLTLDVFNGNRLLLSLDNISIGRGGAASERYRGDDKTPLGEYRVTRINSQSKFHIFMGLDYPSRLQVEQAFRNKFITAAEYRRLYAALQLGEPPPQDSPLGGEIGIHGLGVGNRFLHEMSNWTDGCIALTNAQIDKLRHYVDLDTLVIIR